MKKVVGLPSRDIVKTLIQNNRKPEIPIRTAAAEDLAASGRNLIVGKDSFVFATKKPKSEGRAARIYVRDTKECIQYGRAMNSGTEGKIKLANNDRVIKKLMDAENPKKVTLFKTEYAVLSNFKDVPGVIQVRGAYTYRGIKNLSHQKYVYVMEKAKGTIQDKFQDIIKPLEAGALLRAKACFLQMAACVEAVHERGYLHRDIKPQNFLVVERTPGNNEVVIADFGVAIQTSEELNVNGRDIKGTPLYISGEVIRGGFYSPQSDIYALGATFFKLISGENLATGDNPVSVMYQSGKEGGLEDRAPALMIILKAKYGDTEEVAALGRLIMDMCKRDPAARPTLQDVMFNLS